MKKIIDKIYRKMVMTAWVFPIPVLAIVLGLLSYELGNAMAKINSLYSTVTDISKEEFIKSMASLVLVWLIFRLGNSIFSKIVNHRILDAQYMKWIEKLTNSKLSSITTVGVGGVHTAIGTIAQCDKGIMVSVIAALPNIMPFIIICNREYEAAGILPVIVNVTTITLFILLNILIVNLKSNKKSAEAGASMHSVTVDCINNSKTVKYFQVEDWSVNKQANKQKEVFVDFLNLPKAGFGNLFNILIWVPTIINVSLCWDVKATVLFILMSDYSIINLSNSICDIMDLYSEKKAQLSILGNLEPDNTVKVPLKDKLEIKDVSFKYSEDSDVTFKIDNINIERGKRYCITGKSGFGKSTFIKLITKTVNPTSGNIDSVDCIYMFAESEMFNTSIVENISLGDDSVTESEVQELLDRMEVNIDLDIAKDKIGERGELLSTGQRQRINLARVIVYARRHPGVLVALDEVTSALDEVTSINCINFIAEEFERLNTTLLYVSNKSDYKDTQLITDNIFVQRDGNTVTYVQE